MKSLLEAGVHFGHQTHRWNPKMSRYIYGSRNNIHIIDLQKTVRELKKALAYLKTVAESQKKFYSSGPKDKPRCHSARVQTMRNALCGERWLGGNADQF